LNSARVVSSLQGKKFVKGVEMFPTALRSAKKKIGLDTDKKSVNASKFVKGVSKSAKKQSVDSAKQQHTALKSV